MSGMFCSLNVYKIDMKKIRAARSCYLNSKLLYHSPEKQTQGFVLVKSGCFQDTLVVHGV